MIFFPNGKISMIQSPQDIANLVKEKRKRDGLTQAEAAALCGVGTRFFSEVENGKPSLQLAKVLKVLGGLGLEVEIHERKHGK